ncbi:hypothetical protein LLG96_06675 [bacterium]|nr:hypothetical protein [bacterium]
MTQPVFRKDNAFFSVLLVLFSLYAAIFISRTSFVIDGERYFSLFDDAMVSMRYARNLAGGHGLVMNPGERVEGITNPLWTLYMAAVHLLPVPQPKISLVIQITAAFCLVLNLFFVRSLALLISGNRPPVAIAAVFLTAFYLPLINWSLQGMEVCLLTPLLSCITVRVLRALRENRVPVETYILLGIGTLIRIDMAVPLCGVWLFLLAFGGKDRRKRNLLWGVIVLFIFLGGQTLFRVLYYGDPLPNTYYLKMTGYPLFLRIARGVTVWWAFIWNMNLLLVLVPVAALVLSGDRRTWLPGLLIALQMLYSMYVGGDAWEDWKGSNRYISIIMPQFFILFMWGLFLIKERLGTLVTGHLSSREKKGGKSPELSKNREGAYRGILSFLFFAIVILAFVRFNSNSGSLTLKGMAFIVPPPHVENNKTMVERALVIKQITTPDARIAVTWAGAIPYFSERYTVDILGKTDRTVAHMKMRTPSGPGKYTYFLPGHLKYDYAYSIGRQEPDAVLQFWGDLHEADPYIAGKYVRLDVGSLWFYIRAGSKSIRWELFGTGDPQ